ncbi:hypothetical protein ASV35_19510 [Enterobacter hormaechei subsp. steigerwaltii]|nr:hypothetical protein ASV35_19510 [Enterobacter hormaechei subsp. steigerwaltii]KVJ78516.1 hypothetical protein AWS26_18690 [Enterobacter hormaechei subsp. steigerwaltii]
MRNKLVESESRCAALAAENAGLKAALRPSDIPSEWTDAFGDTAVIEHDSTGDNQWHSVSWSWVGNQEEVIKSVLLAVDKGIETPATDAFLAEVRAQAHKEGAHFVANRMLAAWESGFIDDTAKNAADIARMILTSTEFMDDAPEGDFDRSFADGVLEDIAAQLRQEAAK